jgi:hypothetical protein
MSTEQHEYAFDVLLKAVVRVKAHDEIEAEALLLSEIDACSIDHQVDKATITEVSVYEGADLEPKPHLFEMDGEEIERDEEIVP